MIWQCPVCQLPLQCDDTRWHCANHHSYDCAREGYVNLLPANRKRSKDPGDSAEMLRARRRFLDAGYYRPLVEAVTALLPYTPGRQLLDIGCGEGYYLRALEAAGWPSQALAGVDIAKAGVRLAAKRTPDVQFVVASSVELPLAQDSVDHLLRIFAPAADSEMRRVLNPGGSLLDVSPGPEHLWSLKAALYDEPRLHPPPGRVDGFVPEMEVRCCFPFRVQGREAIADFLMMTPFAWKGSRDMRRQLEQQDSLNLEADFVVRRLVATEP
ncbi:methyltransferase domain-containing protein [Microbulbifer thermotolerans]|uniref:putative RNA methyltransferase n=1 Tax=Microbulbifer thermotolerans TaxID=252514 RepID=UPI002248D7B1|nr:methyltransferase domain-containing protein [Microbulbifer thermotolerans]MCX2781474.1 methyltransferase domain-containing protein [Microbulbifer thermotolerans]MCX2795713.1 methyltransferase domain-containing protein [Microbulbifer thermotolerans]MCX2835318.1 methyltransferase domain-containing protein [Microbulbifer thermotolerans]MCX2842259.1 methyltransferase domain-containing protein [Microbulbifer thermotolerans]WKT59602.1 methyltransferase domain-containing protein [Microbulbifer the